MAGYQTCWDWGEGVGQGEGAGEREGLESWGEKDDGLQLRVQNCVCTFHITGVCTVMMIAIPTHTLTHSFIPSLPLHSRPSP